MKNTRQDLSRKCSAWKVFRLSFCLPPFLGHRVKYGGWDRESGVGVGGPFLSLRIAYISNLSLLLGLETLQKV